MEETLLGTGSPRPSPDRAGPATFVRAVAIALMLLVAVACDSSTTGAPRLIAQDSETRVGTPGQVGEHLFFGYTPFSAEGEQLTVTSAELLGKSPLLRLHRVWAVRISGYIQGSARAETLRNEGVVLEPLSRATFAPGERESWYLMAEVSATRAGRQGARALRVHWKSRRATGSVVVTHGIAVVAS